MSTLKVHHEGWVSLPSALRQELGWNSGDRLEADLVDGAIVLRPAARTRRLARHGREAADSPAADAPSAKRKPGRPRKVADAGGLAPAPAPRKVRGRPRRTTTIREPETAALPAVAIGPRNC